MKEMKYLKTPVWMFNDVIFFFNELKGDESFKR